MKFKFLFLLIIISCKSFGQLFDNEMDYLVYNKQDSLIKSLGVKSLKIIGVDNNDGIEVVEKSYNKKGLLKSEMDDYMRSSRIGYELNKTPLSKKQIAERKKYWLSLGRNNEQVFYDYDALGNALSIKRTRYNYSSKSKKYDVLGIDMDKAKQKGKVKYFNNIVYVYDDLGKLKSIDDCSKRGCNYKSYIYNKDTIKVVEKYSSGLVKKKEIYKGELIETIKTLDSLDNVIRIKKSYYDDKKLTFVKLWSQGNIKEIEKYFLNNKNQILKKEGVRKGLGHMNVNKQLKIFATYKYNDKDRLSLFKELSYYGDRKKSIFSYYFNGLLKSILIENNSFQKKKEFTYEFYKN